MAKKRREKSYDRLLESVKRPGAVVHFVGIGGVSMFSLARLTLLFGARVTGSDATDGERVRALISLGARVSVGHSEENVNSATLVVYSHAISQDNPELFYARTHGVRTVSRAEYLGALMIEYRNRIGVSGSHGKSTTVAILERIFSESGAEPTVLSGADLPSGEPLKLGSENLFVYEACEYKDSFLRFSPTVALALNLELDHTDYFKDINSLKSSFIQALGRATHFSVVNVDDENLSYVASRLKNKVVTYGQSERSDYRYRMRAFLDGAYAFSVERFGNTVGNFELHLPGMFNVNNAVGAIVTALEYGIDAETIARAVAGFRGIGRRLEEVGERFGRPVYYDYAHHPTEIRAAINTLKMLYRDSVTVIFKPHTYTRTASLWEGFRLALSLADHVILSDIYPAREAPIEDITSERLAAEIGERAVYLPEADILTHLDAKTHGTIIVMGAGDMEEIKERVVISRRE